MSHFLLGRGIPEHIVNLPERVFSTPMGALLRPMIENMQNQIRAQGGGGILKILSNNYILKIIIITIIIIIIIIIIIN